MIDRNAPTSIKELAEVVGQRCMVTVWLSDSITFPAQITDVRKVYGRLDYRITPVGGEGEIWVGSDRCKVSEGEGS
jgi:hypothetical protein